MLRHTWLWFVPVLAIWLPISASGFAAQSIPAILERGLGPLARHGLKATVSTLCVKGFAVRQQGKSVKVSDSMVFLLEQWCMRLPKPSFTADA